MGTYSMITPHIKTMTIDGFYVPESAQQICSAIFNLPYTPSDFGCEIENFNMVPQDADALFSTVLQKQVIVDPESGVFRVPSLFVHFENFSGPRDWMFVVALQQCTFNIYEHKSGATSALEDTKFGYRNLFEWDLMVNHILKPGQGVFFRPWLFHTFDTGLIQIFRVQEVQEIGNDIVQGADNGK